MKEKMVYAAYCIAGKIDVSGYRSRHPENLVSAGSSELYYQLNPSQYIYIQGYGAVVFSGMSSVEIREHLERLAFFAIQRKKTFTEDDLEVCMVDNQDQLELSFDTLTLGRFDHAVNKLIMMHLAQSVALDHFNGLIQGILSEIKEYTNCMQNHGKLKLGHRQALKFIGKALNAKNNIAENLYILDSPDTTWDDEYLDRLHVTLLRYFELVQRYKEFDNTLKIIEDNLSVYISYYHHRESSRLEWIIIILIVIEVLDTFAGKLGW